MRWGWLGIGKCPVELVSRPLATGAILVLRTGSGKKTSQAASCIAAQTPGSDGFAIITSQQFYCLVCDPPLLPHPHTLSPLIHKLLLCLIS